MYVYAQMMPPLLQGKGEQGKMNFQKIVSDEKVGIIGPFLTILNLF